MKNVLFVALLSGCAKNGTGEVVSSEDAPWSMDMATAFLFTPGGENDGSQGTGVLAISTDGALACADVVDGPPAKDSGLWFRVSYFTGRNAGSSPPAWNGLYATGTATSIESTATRSLSLGGWHKGFDYDFSDEDAWLEVTRGSQDQFAGSFSNEWWSGEFRAQVCEKTEVAEDAEDAEDAEGEE